MAPPYCVAVLLMKWTGTEEDNTTLSSAYIPPPLPGDLLLDMIIDISMKLTQHPISKRPVMLLLVI